MNQNKYTWKEKIGGGGFGDTYLAEDKKGKQFVIKTLKEEIKQKPDFDKFRIDFNNEALKAAKCEHPHVVKIIETSEHQGLPCIVMEYIRGETLSKKVVKPGKQPQPLPEAEALRYIQQIAEALKVIHKKDLLHRDIKPANIMIRDNGEAILIDFGAARYYNPDDPSYLTAMLTHGYAPMEQYTGSNQGHYTDIYALAATLYYLLTAQLPANAVTRSDSKADPLKPPKSINPNISDRTNNAILQAMALKPQNRPQTITAFLDLLSEKPPVRKKKFPLIPVLSLVAVGGILATVAYVITRPPAYPTWESTEENIQIDRPPNWEVVEPTLGDVAVFVSPKEGDRDYQENLTLTIENVNNISLTQYTQETIARIKQNITQDIIATKETELDNNSATQVVYQHQEAGKSLKTQQTWTIEGDRAYILTYTAIENNNKYDDEVQRMIESLVIDR